MHLMHPNVPVTELLARGIPVSSLDGTIGFLIGGALPFLFSAFCLRAVTRGANLVVDEVRRQFKVPGVLEGTTKPDIARVVAITTSAAQKELISLVALAVGPPLLVGLVFGLQALGTFLAGVILTGQLLAVLWQSPAARWTMPRSTSRTAISAGRVRLPTRPRSRVTPWATRSRIRPGLRSTR